LGVLAIVGRGLPPRFRALLLALAVIDDLIAILIIAVFFTAHLAIVPLLVAVPVVAAFGWLSRPTLVGKHKWLTAVLVALGLVAWGLVYNSGVHPTVAGVALGLVMADPSAGRSRHALEPWSNVVILPLFALVAALVPVPTSSVTELSPAFWAVLVALPLGKLVGVSAGALVASRLVRESPGARMPVGDVIAVAGLAGIGFTVSLLMNDLAFATSPELADQVTLSVLLASVIAALVGGALTSARGRHYLRASRQA
jgi:NhaA family Na+:H+ antiporter